MPLESIKISSKLSWLKSSNAICVNELALIGTLSITRVAGVRVKARRSPDRNGTRISEKPSASQSVKFIEKGKRPFKPSNFSITRGPESKTPPML